MTDKPSTGQPVVTQAIGTDSIKSAVLDMTCANTAPIEWDDADWHQVRRALAAWNTRASHTGDDGMAGDLAAIGPRPTGKVLAWADPRPCFYSNSIGECGHCYGCHERITRAALTPPSDQRGEG